MILRAVPQKKKDEFNLIDDIRVISDSSIESGKDSYIHYFPKLPAKLNKFYHSKQEKVNLYDYTCTCEQFKENSKFYLDRDIRRSCKHIYYKATTEWVTQYIDPITIAILKISVFNGYKHLYKVNIYNKDYYFIINPDSAWVKVLTMNDLNLSSEYHYHTLDKRWGYNNKPVNDVFIVDQIHKIIKYQLPVEHPYKVYSELEKY